jgi:leucine dehydrogenase
VTALELAGHDAHEEVLVVQDPASGLRAVIALHDTSLGPAVGGTRMRVYPSLEEATLDALRLARAMSYKAVMSGVERGGGKAVILGDPARDKSRALLVAYAKVLDRLDGRFHTGCDMGIDARDVAVLGRLCKHVSHTAPDAKLETAGLAALGVFASIRAAARRQGAELRGLRVAVQGLGQVGYRLARQLHAAGAVLVVSDVEASRTDRARSELGAEVVEPEAIYDVEVDVFSPNAGGSVINDDTVPRLRCRAVAGAANEQLAEPRHGDALFARDILYAPDYVANAGGLLSLLYELGETDEEGVTRRVEAIGDRLNEIWHQAATQGRPPHVVADEMAEERLAAARAARRAQGRHA